MVVENRGFKEKIGGFVEKVGGRGKGRVFGVYGRKSGF